MKTLLCSCLLFAGTLIASHGAVVFSGGGSSPVVLTFTNDFVVPVTVSANSVSSVGFVFNGAYSTPITGNPRSNPNESYGSSGTISVTVNLASGGTVDGFFYGVFGAINSPSGNVGNQDFYGYVFLSNGVNLSPGDLIVFGAGSVSFNQAYIQIPDRPIESVFAFEASGFTALSGVTPIPEASSLLLGGLGAIGLFRRRR